MLLTSFIEYIGNAQRGYGGYVPPLRLAATGAAVGFCRWSPLAILVPSPPRHHQQQFPLAPYCRQHHKWRPLLTTSCHWCPCSHRRHQSFTEEYLILTLQQSYLCKSEGQRSYPRSSSFLNGFICYQKVKKHKTKHFHYLIHTVWLCPQQDSVQVYIVEAFFRKLEHILF